MSRLMLRRSLQPLIQHQSRSAPVLPPQFLRYRLRFQSIRHASTTSEVATDARSLATRLKNLIYGTGLIVFFSFGYLYITDTRASIHEWLVVPALRAIYKDAEDAHHAGTAMLKVLRKFGLNPRERDYPDSDGALRVEVFGHTLDNSIGTSAGIDKGAEIPSALFDLGPAIVEVGAVTPLPQEGNPKPRVFRLPSQNALINRYGFNSEGAPTVAMRLRQRVREFAYSIGLGTGPEAEKMVLDGEAGVPPGSLVPGKLMAVQVAKNKGTHEGDIEAVSRDYVAAVQEVGKYADIVVVNVSSPNTPGLRTLQSVGPLTHLLTEVVQAVKSVDRKTKPAVMVKVSPDEDGDAQVQGICEAVWDSDVDGIIVGNTTKKRPDPLPRGYMLPTEEAALLLEQGGYSGPQMFERTLKLVKKYRAALDEGPKQVDLGGDKSSASKGESEGSKPVAPLDSGENPEGSVLDKLEKATSKVTSSTTGSTGTQQRKVLFATGGITNGEQALEVLNAGASVAMVYTAMIYSGAGTISRIKGEMREELRKR